MTTKGYHLTHSINTQRADRKALFGHLPVLVVEDCQVTARIIKKILADLAFDVHSANNGERALTAFAQRAFALILMDYEMPVMNGIEATLAIRKAEKATGSHTPIIGYSASADSGACLAAGMDDYLRKPASAAALGAKVALWCDMRPDCPDYRSTVKATHVRRLQPWLALVPC